MTNPLYQSIVPSVLCKHRGDLNTHPSVRRIAGLSLTIAMLLLMNLPAVSQDAGIVRRSDPRELERRNRFYQDLKRDFHDFGKNDFSRGSNRCRRNLAPATPIDDSSAALEKLRAAIDRFAREADALQVALNTDVDLIHGVRSILPDVIQLSVSAQVLNDRCAHASRINPLSGDVEALDRDWQSISYKLRRIPAMARTAEIKRIDILDGLDRQFDGICKIGPQFDQRELLRETVALSDRLQRLAEDVELEVIDPQLRRTLCSAARRAQSEAQMVCNVVDSGTDPTEVVGEFQEYLALWGPLSQQIRRADAGHSLERSVLRISSTNREIAELLRTPQSNDVANLGYVMEALKRDINEFFTRAPLKLLMELPDSRSALVTAGAFYASCDQFLQLAGRNASQAELAESFRKFTGVWQVFERTFRPITSEVAQRLLNRIEENTHSLAEALQLFDQQFDRRRASEVAYALIAAADNIRRDTRLWLERDRVSFEVNDALRVTDSFVTHCQRISDDVSGNMNSEQLRQEVLELYEHYKRVYPFISQCRGSVRPSLGENALRAKSALVDLRAMLEI